MTQHFPTRQLRFFMTANAPCPYLPGQFERKVFANLPFSDGADVNDALTQAGFRRSQNIAYRPACEACAACVSVRIPVAEFVFSRSQRKVLNRNADLSRDLVEAEATMEQFDLLRRYLSARHPGGGMSDMGWSDYVSMVYSFFDPDLERRSLGQFAIMDHLRQAAMVGLPYVYLGYWVQGSPKMDYKAKFRPMEALRPLGWERLL